MDSTPTPPPDRDPDAGDALGQPGAARIDRVTPRSPTGRPRWNLEMLESPLMDRGLTYTVSDGSSTDGADEGNGWIDFELPTEIYTNASGRKRVRIRLTVNSGRLAITSPDFYPPGSLKRTTKPPPDAAGNLRVVRLGSKGESNLDLFMAADGTVTAVLVMETILRPFNRADIVQLAEQFAVGLELLDFAVRKERLLLPRSGEST